MSLPSPDPPFPLGRPPGGPDADRGAPGTSITQGRLQVALCRDGQGLVLDLAHHDVGPHPGAGGGAAASDADLDRAVAFLRRVTAGDPLCVTPWPWGDFDPAALVRELGATPEVDAALASVRCEWALLDLDDGRLVLRQRLVLPDVEAAAAAINDGLRRMVRAALESEQPFPELGPPLDEILSALHAEALAGLDWVAWDAEGLHVAVPLGTGRAVALVAGMLAARPGDPPRPDPGAGLGQLAALVRAARRAELVGSQLRLVFGDGGGCLTSDRREVTRPAERLRRLALRDRLAAIGFELPVAWGQPPPQAAPSTT